MILETPRLLLRELVEEDTDALHACDQLPEVVRYTPRGTRTREETREYILKGIVESSAEPRSLFDLGVVERA